jgi:peptidoglycan hydrolase-like protein with peptidoglycan-binding domain
VAKGDRYNTALATVVKQFQRGKAIEADGLVGRQTWNALW